MLTLDIGFTNKLSIKPDAVIIDPINHITILVITFGEVAVAPTEKCLTHP